MHVLAQPADAVAKIAFVMFLSALYKSDTTHAEISVAGPLMVWEHYSCSVVYLIQFVIVNLLELAEKWN